MSFDIFVQRFRNDALAKYPRAFVEKAFASFIKSRHEKCWELEFCGRSGPTIFIDNEVEIDGFSVNNPGDDEFWQALVRLLQDTGCLLHWPGGGAVVTDEALIAHIPADFIEGLGTPIVTTDLETIYEAIRRS